MAKINDILNGNSPLKDKHTNGDESYDPKKQVVKRGPDGKLYIVDPSVSTDITSPSAGDLIKGNEGVVTGQMPGPKMSNDDWANYLKNETAEQKKARLQRESDAGVREGYVEGGMAGHGIVGNKKTTVSGNLNEETIPGEKGMYNPSARDAINAKIANRVFNKIEKKKNRKARRDIRKYEEGSRGFLGIGKGKGKGDLTGDVAGAYESVYGDKVGKANENLVIGPGGKVIGDADQGLSTQQMSRKNRVQFDQSQIKSGGTTSDTPETTKIKNKEFKGDINSVIDVSGGSKVFNEEIPVGSENKPSLQSNINAFGGQESIADKFKKNTDEMMKKAGLGTVAFKLKKT